MTRTSSSFLFKFGKTLLALALLSQAAPGFGASNFSFTPPPLHTPPLMQTPPPPGNTSPPPPVIQMPPSAQNPGLTVNPVDVTGVNFVDPVGGQSQNAMWGVISLSSQAFPSDANLSGNGDYLLARGAAGSEFHRDSPCSVTVKSGQVLLSMRRPTKLAFVNFAFGQISLAGDADVLVCVTDGVFRMINLSGRCESVKVKLSRGPFADQNANVIAVASGYELVAADHQINRSDVRIADGFARRHFKVLNGGNAAVSEISIESVLTSNAIIASLATARVDQERRVVADMSKMAAVLNYINGTQGFEQTGSTQVAHR